MSLYRCVRPQTIYNSHTHTSEATYIKAKDNLDREKCCGRIGCKAIEHVIDANLEWAWVAINLNPDTGTKLGIDVTEAKLSLA